MLLHLIPILFTYTIGLWSTALSMYHLLTLLPQPPGSHTGSGSLLVGRKRGRSPDGVIPGLCQQMGEGFGLGLAFQS